MTYKGQAEELGKLKVRYPRSEAKGSKNGKRCRILLHRLSEVRAVKGSLDLMRWWSRIVCYDHFP